MDKLDMESKNIVSSNIKKIKELFPNVITEDNGKEIINFDALKQELSDVIIDEKKEKYQLTWPGKKQAIVNANSPINKTLRPLKNKSVNFDSTKNIYIEGDNLDVLKLLQESYLNKIKLAEYIISLNKLKSSKDIVERTRKTKLIQHVIKTYEGKTHRGLMNMLKETLKSFN